MPDTGLKKRRIRVNRGREREKGRERILSMLRIGGCGTTLSYNLSLSQLLSLFLHLTTSLPLSISQQPASPQLSTLFLSIILLQAPLIHPNHHCKKGGRSIQCESFWFSQSTVEIRFQGRKRREWMSCHFMIGIIMQNGH